VKQLLNEKELKDAAECNGNCEKCNVSDHDFYNTEFGCTKELANEVLVLLEQNRKLTNTKKCSEHVSLPSHFKGKSVYLNKTEMFLLHSALMNVDLENTNEIYWNDIRNIFDKIKPVIELK
jgi:hypothetical protein